MTGTKASRELQALLDAAVDGIIVIDRKGIILSFNRSAEQLFGLSAGEAVGRNVGMLMSAADRSAHDTSIERYLRTNVAHVIGRGREVTAQRKDGTPFPAFLSLEAVPGPEPRFVGFIRDISATRKSEEDAHRLQDRLMHVSRLATVGEMASGIAHELNQPLAAIATYAHACDRLLALPEPEISEVQDALRQIAEQAVRAGDEPTSARRGVGATLEPSPLSLPRDSLGMSPVGRANQTLDTTPAALRRSLVQDLDAVREESNSAQDDAS